MYLHLGNDFIVNEKDIIGIFDIEKSINLIDISKPKQEDKDLG